MRKVIQWHIMKQIVVIVTLLVINVSCKPQLTGFENNSSQFVSILKKLDEIQNSNVNNAQSLQKELSELKIKQENMEASTNKLRRLFEDIKRQEAGNAQLLITLSQDIDHLKSKGVYAEGALNKTVNSLRIILQSALVNLGGLLMTAVQDGDSHQVLLLLDLGAPVEYANEKKDRPIHVAIKNGHPQILEILLERRAEIEAQGEYEKTALHLSTYHSCLECTRILLDKGANPNCRDQWKNTPLIHPAAIGFNECVELLLKNGADVNAAQEEGYTGLHFACRDGRLETVQLLARYGADFWKSTRSGDTPLSFAKANRHWEIVGFVENKLKVH